MANSKVAKGTTCGCGERSEALNSANSTCVEGIEDVIEFNASVMRRDLDEVVPLEESSHEGDRSVSASGVAGSDDGSTQADSILHIADVWSGTTHGGGGEDAGDHLVPRTN